MAELEPSPKTLQEENKEAMQEDPVSQEGTMERTSGKRRHNGDTHEGDTYETDTALRAGRTCQWPRTRERLPMIQKLQSNRNWQWLDEGKAQLGPASKVSPAIRAVRLAARKGDIGRTSFQSHVGVWAGRVPQREGV